MEQEFEAQACNLIGEAVWQLVTIGESVRPDAINSMIMQLSERHDDLATSIALSVLHQT